MRREVLVLIGTVLAVDALFIAGYFVAGLDTARGPLKLGYAALWTAVTLLLVIRSLTRIRALRYRARP